MIRWPGMSSPPPSVSVIIPSFNARPFIRQAIESVLPGHRFPVEVVVVDDGSTDGSADHAEATSPSVRVLRQQNRGACAARNVGMAVSRGPLLMFLDADDFVAPGTLDALANALVDNPGTSLAVCPWSVVKPEGHVNPGGGVPPPVAKEREDLLTEWLLGRFTPPCAVLWRREALLAIGGWDEKVLKNQDGDVVMRALADGATAIRARNGMGYYRDHTDGRPAISQKRGMQFSCSQFAVLLRVESMLVRRGALETYRVPLARAFHRLSRDAAVVDARLSRLIDKHGRALAGWAGIPGRFPSRVAEGLIGSVRMERVARMLGRRRRSQAVEGNPED